ncbi:glycosyltransferase [Microbacterium hydrocarbonoxydans]|uniref:glycosyltransferase n=1 Tax=Microbacterium hydrocarbonoxydans TaxID=273678 RepID=UPI0032634C0B
MRVLMITPWYPTPDSPKTGVFVHRDADTLRASHDVDVLHLCPPSQSMTPEPGVIRLPYRVASPLAVLRARRAVRSLAADYDLVHTHAISVLPAIPRLRAPWVHTEHWSGVLNPRTASLPVRVAGAALLRALRRPAVVIAVSGLLATAVRRHRRGPVIVIPNAVMAPVAMSGVRADDLTMISVGGLIRRKRPLLAVETLAALVRAGRSARLIWIGDGPQREAVLARAAELGVRERVLLRGDVSPEEVSAELLAARIFLLPTEAETFGVAIAEALRHGLPVVVGDDGGHLEYVGPDDGRLVGSADPEEWARAVEGALQLDSDQIARRAQDRFSEQARAHAFDEAYALAAEMSNR